MDLGKLIFTVNGKGHKRLVIMWIMFTTLAVISFLFIQWGYTDPDAVARTRDSTAIVFNTLMGISRFIVPPCWLLFALITHITVVKNEISIHEYGVKGKAYKIIGTAPFAFKYEQVNMVNEKQDYITIVAYGKEHSVYLNNPKEIKSAIEKRMHISAPHNTHQNTGQKSINGFCVSCNSRLPIDNDMMFCPNCGKKIK